MVPSGYSAPQRSSLACSVTVIMLFLLRSPALLRLFEEFLGLAQLILGGALRLLRASFGLLGFIAGYGAGGLFGLALCLNQCPFALVLNAALFAHASLSLLRSSRASLCLPVREPAQKFTPTERWEMVASSTRKPSLQGTGVVTCQF